jgi:protease I
MATKLMLIVTKAHRPSDLRRAAPMSAGGGPLAIGFVQEAAAGKIVAAICHGPWVLSDAGLTRGKRATGWWSIKPDLENAGATFIDEPAITDGKIVTARAPIDLAAFVHAIDDLLVAA